MRYDDSEIESLLQDNRKIDWKIVCRNGILSEGFIYKYSNFVDWKLVSKYQALGDTTIQEFYRLVDWNAITRYQHPSWNIVRQFRDYVDWECISQHWRLTRELVGEFYMELNLGIISRRQYIDIDNDYLRSLIVMKTLTII